MPDDNFADLIAMSSYTQHEKQKLWCSVTSRLPGSTPGIVNLFNHKAKLVSITKCQLVPLGNYW